jgi:hypothetical protein
MPAEVVMGATLLVVLLVGLVIPIVMLLAAVVFDIVLLAWLAYRVTHERVIPYLSGAAHRVHWMPHFSGR